MNIGPLIQNHVLWTGMVGWFLASVLKIPVDFIRERRWNWALFFTTGGMPSSHSCLVTSTAMAVGLHYGFDTPLFAVALTLALVVVYDAMGVRRQAGKQAQKINVLVEELLKGHPINEKHLLEAIGHTPLEALSGVLLGLTVAVSLWLWWR
jgi:acid phosphatase family membrane protein YuiD